MCMVFGGGGGTVRDWSEKQACAGRRVGFSDNARLLGGEI